MSILLDLIDNDVAELAASSALEPLDGASVIITGASGLVGAYMVATLRRRARTTGHRINIHAVALREPPTHLAPLFDGGGVHFYRCDLADSAGCRVLPVADHIIHAAGYGQPGKFLENRVATILLNTTGTAALLEKLARHGSFLFVSSSQIYSGSGLSPHHEDDIGNTDPGHPRSSYIEGKRCGEAICHAFRARQTNVRIARLAPAYGPGTRWDDQRVLYSLIRRALVERSITLMDRGDARRTYCYIVDAVEMLFSILLSGKGSVYNVGGRSAVTILELAQAIGRKLSVPVFIPEMANGMAGAPSDVALDIERYCQEFGKTEFTALDLGLGKTIEWQQHLYEYGSGENAHGAS